MAARSRPGYALRTLLGDERARVVAQEAVTAIAAGSGATPVVLSIPSPARWLRITAEQAGQEPVPPDPDRADTAAMYIADFLRIFAGEGADGLLLDEGPAPPGDLIHPEAYRSVLNVADHYEWPVLISCGTAPAWPHGAVSGVAGWIGSAAPSQAAGRSGIFAGADFWAGAEPASGADLLLAVVPAGADPGAGDERILQLLGSSIEGNVDTILHMFQHGIGIERVEPPSAALEYSRRVAERASPSRRPSRNAAAQSAAIASTSNSPFTPAIGSATQC